MCCWLSGWQKAIRSAAPQNRSRGSSIRAKCVAGRALAPGGRARDSFLRRKANLVRDHHSVRGDQAIRTGRLRAMLDAPDHLDRWADAFRVETRTLPKQKASH